MNIGNICAHLLVSFLCEEQREKKKQTSTGSPVWGIAWSYDGCARCLWWLLKEAAHRLKHAHSNVIISTASICSWRPGPCSPIVSNISSWGPTTWETALVIVWAHAFLMMSLRCLVVWQGTQVDEKTDSVYRKYMLLLCMLWAVARFPIPKQELFGKKRSPYW